MVGSSGRGHGATPVGVARRVPSRPGRHNHRHLRAAPVCHQVWLSRAAHYPRKIRIPLRRSSGGMTPNQQRYAVGVTSATIAVWSCSTAMSSAVLPGMRAPGDGAARVGAGSEEEPNRVDLSAGCCRHQCGVTVVCRVVDGKAMPEQNR